MPDESTTSSGGPRRPGLVRGQPAWKKALLMVALLVAAAGGLMTAVGHYRSSQEPADAAPEAAAPDGAPQRGFLPAGTPSGAEVVAAKQNLLERHGPTVARTGLSFAVGYVLGFGMRRFVKTVATLAAIGVVGLVALKYFNVVDLNLDQFQEEARGFVEWARAQAGAVKDWIITYLPSASAGTAGVATGFVRR